MSEKHLSTTALARQIHKESKELFTLLAQGGWIIKVDNHWQLTEKGKFEGGIYINSPKYGEYIAWPESIQDHPLLRLLPEAPLTATHLGHKVDLPARLINLLLAERGWIKKHIRGWLLTPRGKAIGGEQHSHEQTGVPYVSWPESLLDNPQFQQVVAQANGSCFAQTQFGLSGHVFNSREALILGNWLYLAAINHACHYPLQVGAEQVKVDFYVPEVQLCIDIWTYGEKPADLAEKLHKQEFYRQHNYEYLELQDETVAQLDELLAKHLLQLGLAVY